MRPFFAHGGKISIREFLVGAFNDEMGLQSVDPELMQAHNGSRIVTRSGMVLDGSTDRLEAPPTDLVNDDPDHDGVTNEIPASLVDFMEFYLLNYFKPGLFPPDDTASNLDPGNRNAFNFPQFGHGSIKLSAIQQPDRSGVVRMRIGHLRDLRYLVQIL